MFTPKQAAFSRWQATDTMPPPQPPGWQAFDTSTEAGRMLKKLYGGAAGHPNIAYPKLTTKPAPTGPKPSFVGGGARVGARDPRDASRKKVSVAVPHRKRPESQYRPIDFVRRKKTVGAIEEGMADMRMRNDAYRPPRTRVFSTEDEKARLQEKCQYGGGKGLPREMTMPAGPCPSELRAELKEEQRVAKEWRKRRGEPEPAPRAAPPPPDLRVELVDTISAEIDDRQRFLDSMAKLGQHNDNTRRIESEIATRKHELSKAAARLDA